MCATRGAAGVRQHQHVAHSAVALSDRENEDAAGRLGHVVRQLTDPLGLGHQHGDYHADRSAGGLAAAVAVRWSWAGMYVIEAQPFVTCCSR